MIRLHHGSNVPIIDIDLSKSHPGKDFGIGFYLNPDYFQALDWAKTRVVVLKSGIATVTSYEFDIDRAQKDGLSIKVFDDYTEEWAEFVVANRKNSSDRPTHDYDIVIGPIADDNVGRQIQLYMLGYWSIPQLIDKIKYTAKKSMQYFFASEKSLTYLSKIHE